MDTKNMSSTTFEKHLSEFLELCDAISKSIPRTEKQFTDLKEKVKYYNAVYKSTLDAGSAHERNILAFRKLVTTLPTDYDELVELNWLVDNDHTLRFVKLDGSFAEKAMLPLTSLYQNIAVDIDRNEFVFRLLRCCEVSDTETKRQAVFGRAAMEYELSFESMKSEEETVEDNASSFKNALSELKKVVTNKSIIKTMAGEMQNLVQVAKDNPALVESFEGVVGEQGTMADRFGIIQRIAHDYVESPNNSTISAEKQ